jgi:YVTN family beta-propeller protein
MCVQNVGQGRARIAREVFLRSMLFVSLLGAMAVVSSALAWTGKPLAYVTNSGNNTVSVIDTGDNAIVDTVHVGSAPQFVAVAPDGKHAYVGNADGMISVIETSAQTATLSGTISGVPPPVALAVNPDGQSVYSLAYNPGSVSVIDTATSSLTHTIRVGNNAVGIAVSPDGARAYVTNSSDNTVSVIDTASNAVVDTIKVQALPFGIGVSPDGEFVYVANAFAEGDLGSVSVIDTSTDAIVATIPVVNPTFLALNPAGTQLYVVGSNFTTVYAIDTSALKIVATIPVGNTLFGIAATPDGTRLYVPSFFGENVFVIDTATNQVTATLTGFASPTGVGIIPPASIQPFQAFNVAGLDIRLRDESERRQHETRRGDSFAVRAEFVLNRDEKVGFDPDTQPVTLQVGPFTTTIPAGSFTRHGEHHDGVFRFEGATNAARLEIEIRPKTSLRYEFHAKATGANLMGVSNPVQVALRIGDEAGAAQVRAHFHQEFDQDFDQD